MDDEELGWGPELSKLIGLGPWETDMAVQLGFWLGEEMPGSLYPIALLPIVRERSKELRRCPIPCSCRWCFRCVHPMALNKNPCPHPSADMISASGEAESPM
jgi:hypothetical protein